MLIRVIPIIMGGCFALSCVQKTDCRKYATAIKASNGARIDCSFDEKKAQKRCVSGNITSLYAYRSLGEFIEEGQAISRRLWISLDITGSVSRRVLNGIDEGKRIVSSVTTEGSTIVIDRALDWDAYQRPIRFSSSYDSGTGDTCSGRIETAQINDAGLTLETQVDYTQSVGTGAFAGAPCAGSANSSSVLRYDGDRELIANGSTTYTILSKSEVCQ